MRFKKALKKDPYLKYGVGIKSYFSLQQWLIQIFCVLSLFAIAQMIIFKQFGGLEYLDETVSWNTLHSFGNMGFSSSICSRAVIFWDGDYSD